MKKESEPEVSGSDQVTSEGRVVVVSRTCVGNVTEYNTEVLT